MFEIPGINSKGFNKLARTRCPLRATKVTASSILGSARRLLLGRVSPA